MINRAKANAYKFLAKRKQTKKLSYENLHEIIFDKGFKVICYKKYNYSDELRLLIDKLDIEKEIQEKDCFFLIKDNLKLIFLNDDVSDDDKYILLSHEIGHIFDERILESEITYSNAQRENYANEFSHYLHNPSVIIKPISLILKKPLMCSLILIIVLVSSFGNSLMVNKVDVANYTSTPMAINNSTTLQPNMYYVTSSGEKYHRSFCKHVKYKINITEYPLDEAISMGYLPCLDCIGDTFD